MLTHFVIKDLLGRLSNIDSSNWIFLKIQLNIDITEKLGIHDNA